MGKFHLYILFSKSLYIVVTSRGSYGHVKWVPGQHGMARPQVADGGDGLRIWRVAANILNMQSRIADKGWSSSLEVGRWANNSHREK
jgi:hypothetical protein